MALVLFSLLVFTGILMVFSYEPSPERAWHSIVAFQEDVLFGRLIRGVHYWSANLLIPVTVLHLLRVFLTGGYYGRRRPNWLLGLGILSVVLLSGFTGYLLPWDQTAFWATTASMEMIGLVPGIGPALQQIVVGGDQIGSPTVIKFYASHIVVAPALLVALLSWHFWHIRKAGGVVLPAGPFDDPRSAFRSVPLIPHLVIRELVVALVLIAFVLVLAIVFGAPLGEIANPGVSPNPAKAPWYLLGIQELLIHFDATFAILLIPLLVALGLIAVAFIPYEANIAGDWFLTDKGRRMAAIAMLTTLLLVPLWIIFDEMVAGPGGLMSFAVMVAGLGAFYVLIGRIFAATRIETVQALFVLLFVALVVLTITGAWFRGPSMTLMWPWQI